MAKKVKCAIHGWQASLDGQCEKCFDNNLRHWSSAIEAEKQRKLSDAEEEKRIKQISNKEVSSFVGNLILGAIAAIAITAIIVAILNSFGSK